MRMVLYLSLVIAKHWPWNLWKWTKQINVHPEKPHLKHEKNKHQWYLVFFISHLYRGFNLGMSTNQSNGWITAPPPSVNLVCDVDRYEGSAMVTFHLVKYHPTCNNIPVQQSLFLVSSFCYRVLLGNPFQHVVIFKHWCNHLQVLGLEGRLVVRVFVPLLMLSIVRALWLALFCSAGVICITYTLARICMAHNSIVMKKKSLLCQIFPFFQYLPNLVDVCFQKDPVWQMIVWWSSRIWKKNHFPRRSVFNSVLIRTKLHTLMLNLEKWYFLFRYSWKVNCHL